MATSQWNIDPAHSSIQFHVRHLMVAKVHGRFTKWTGTLALDDQDLTRSKLDIKIDATSIETQEGKRDEHLKSADFLDVAKFPDITFKGGQITRAGDEHYKLAGELTIHGVTKPVTLDVEGGAQLKDPWGSTRTGFSAHTSINRKDFGLAWNVALEAGGVLVGDKLEIGIEIEATKAG